MFKKVFFLSLITLIFASAALGQKGAGATATKADPAKDVRAVFDRLVDGIKQADATKASVRTVSPFVQRADASRLRPCR